MEETDHSTIWLMPHPLAYLYRVSKDVDSLKATMKDYCSKIQQVQQESNAIGQKLFSRKPSKTLGFWIRRLESLEEEEKQYRASFQLARCLWQLEGIMVETYMALTKWRRSKSQMEKLVENDCHGCSCNDSENEECCSPQQNILRRLQREEDDSQTRYEQCGYDQAIISKEIGSYIGLDLSAPEPSFPGCDDYMIEYTLRNYYQCSLCNYYFNKKDLGIFGQIRTVAGCCGSGSGDKSQSKALTATSVADAAESFSQDDLNEWYTSFHCLECYKAFSNQSDEQESDQTIGGDPITDCCGENSQQKIQSIQSHSDSIGTNSQNANKENKSSSGKRRTRKKKKKKAAVVSNPSTSTPEKKRDTKVLSSYPSPTSVAMDCSTHENAKTMISNHEGKNISFLEHCSDTTATSCSTTTTNRFSDSSHCVAESSTRTANIEADPNELYVEYLWKTGSMIALDRYMDEMEGNLGTECCI